jgi:hypothetical protein
MPPTLNERAITLYNQSGGFDIQQVAAILGVDAADVAEAIYNPGYEIPDPNTGDNGGGSGAEVQVFEFEEPSSEWVCHHNLGRDPLIAVYDLQGNLRPFVPAEQSEDDNTTTLTPTPPLAGKVVIA